MLRFQYNFILISGITKWGIFSAKSGYFYYAIHTYLNTKEKEFLVFLLKKRLYEFTPIEVSKMTGVTNKTVINRCAKLVNNGFLIPIIVKTRIRSYQLSDFSRTNEKKILKKFLQ